MCVHSRKLQLALPIIISSEFIPTLQISPLRPLLDSYGSHSNICISERDEEVTYCRGDKPWFLELLTMLAKHCPQGRKREKNVLFNDALNTFYLRLYGVRHMVRTILIVRKESRCRHIGYSCRLTARVLLYTPSHRHDNTYHGLCYTSRGALAGTRNSSMGQPHEGSIRRPIAP